MGRVRVTQDYGRDTPSTWKGTLLLPESAFPTTNLLQNANVLPIISTSELELRERRLIVSVLQSVSPAIAGSQQGMPGTRVGSYFTSLPGSAVVLGSLGRRYNLGLRISCKGYASSVMQCDAKQGVYRIPPSTEVNVEAVLSRCNTNGTYSPVQVRVELSDSCDGPVTRPTETVSLNLEPATLAIVELNPRVRWIDLIAAGESFLGSATAPIMQGMPYNPLASPDLGTLGPMIERNYVDKTWFPSGEPVDLGAGGSCFADNGRGNYQFTNAGTGDAYTQFIQYLEW